MEAFTEQGDHVALYTDRLVGCGPSVRTCPSAALTLVRKPDSQRAQVPPALEATWPTISQAQAEMH
jgi:ferredoxin